MDAVASEPNRILSWNETYEIRLALEKHIVDLKKKVEEYTNSEFMDELHIRLAKTELDDARRAYDALRAPGIVRVRVGVDV